MTPTSTQALTLNAAEQSVPELELIRQCEEQAQ
jgi:hypothetical protein